MIKPLIYFVDDEPNLLNGLKRFCRPQRQKWTMRFFTSGQAALDALHQQTADMVISDMRMPGVSGADLFEEISQNWPGIIRIILSGEAEPEQTMRTVGRSHRFLAKPCDSQTLIQSIDAPLQLRATLGLPQPKQEASYLDHLKTPANLFIQIQDILEKNQASDLELANIISTDAALSARILQLANSAYFGRPVTTCNIAKAVETLGCDRIKKLLARKRLGNHFQDVPQQLLDENRHYISKFRSLCNDQFETSDLTQIQKDLIFASGLFHSLGKLLPEGKPHNAGLPAYMATLLGLPEDLSTTLLQLASLPPERQEPEPLLAAIIALVKHTNSKAA